MCTLRVLPLDSSLYSKVQAAHVYREILTEVAEVAMSCGQVLVTGLA